VLLPKRKRRVVEKEKGEQAGKGTVGEYYKIGILYWPRGD
jgi:hypothetical protein